MWRRREVDRHARTPWFRRVLRGRLLRYGAGSVVATVCSEVTFLVLFGWLATSTTTASVLGWLAGAVPNYWLNRTWTWGRRGTPSLRREVVPYVMIVLVTLGLAVAATAEVNSVLTGVHASHDLRAVLVAGSFLAVYLVVFLLRFLLFDRLFAGTAPQPASATSEAVSARGEA